MAAESPQTPALRPRYIPRDINEYDHSLKQTGNPLLNDAERQAINLKMVTGGHWGMLAAAAACPFLLKAVPASNPIARIGLTLTALFVGRAFDFQTARFAVDLDKRNSPASMPFNQGALTDMWGGAPLGIHAGVVDEIKQEWQHTTPVLTFGHHGFHMDPKAVPQK